MGTNRTSTETIMKKYDYKGLEIWKIQNGIDIIQCNAGHFNYSQVTSKTWQLSPEVDSPLKTMYFESEQMLLDFVLNLNENTDINHCTEETEIIN